MNTILTDFLVGSVLVITSLLIGMILIMILLRKFRIRKRKKDSE